MPSGGSDVSLGEISRSGDEGVADTTAEELAPILRFDVADLATLAEQDDAMASIANAWRNFDPASETTWTASLENSYVANLRELDTATPEDYELAFSLLLIDSNVSDAVTIRDAICTDPSALELVPPTTFTTESGVTYSPSSPIVGAGTTSDMPNGCSSELFSVEAADQASGGVGLTIQLRLEGGVEGLPEGLFRLRIDGIERALFEIASVSPYLGDGTFELPSPIATEATVTAEWAIVPDEASGQRRLDGLAITYVLAGQGHRFSWKVTQPICGDGILDPSEACDGTNFGGFTCTEGTLTCVDCSFIDDSSCTTP